jgi:hypothetical protein
MEVQIRVLSEMAQFGRFAIIEEMKTEDNVITVCQGETIIEVITTKEEWMKFLSSRKLI